MINRKRTVGMWRLLVLIIICVLNSEGKIGSELLNVEWEDLVSAGGMHIGHGRTKRFVGLNENEPNIPHQACFLPNGKTGHCRHLRYCVQNDFKMNFIKFMDYLCIINYSSIGVCCSDDIVQGSADRLAGDLPATAPKDENAVDLKIGRANNRGCGLSTRAQNNVIGSRPTNPRDWPWMALILTPVFENSGGGVLITDRHVLTAAHCTHKLKTNQLSVRLGEYDLLRTNDSRSYNFQVVEKRQHKFFDSSNYQNDIVILKLHKPAVFNKYVWPICLPPKSLELENKLATVIGWGTLKYDGRRSNILMEVSVPIWNHETCVESYGDTVFNENICAAGKEGGMDACQGDSGGPLMYQISSGRWVVVGLVSWGFECGRPSHPGIYLKIDHYRDWIHENAIFF